ncbi:MAGa7180 family putative nuclease [Mycoplasmopsis pullorum]|uniref:MAGa7180 family putative nuclease n=1 Tax=Mycoplasmopsis pullorum TaxID=48003 RepID=UPI00111ACA95|nr:YqaJ viral recombinase family protein [Mycoplasmopsis pullorum]TNK83282.1 hypothetical protein C4M93_02670 [Mycoplasmopsis pullorum]TNK88078.1 hypothetical protein C4M89_03705 [Mycoplasmopsis pullorum]TNK91785.1 hypothetical protein C4M96_03455 [Mycoplasmopsis pullorum]
MKRKFFNKKDYWIEEKERRLFLYKNDLIQKLWKIKKITGTTFAQLTKENPFKGEFDLFCNIFSLTPPLLISKYVDVGVVVEPKVIEFLHQKFPNHKIKHIEAKDVGYDMFARDSFFGGVPDGFCETEDSIIEIKTTSITKKHEIMNKKIPQHYIRQAQLYCYLMNKQKFKFVYAFIDETKGEYENPHKIKLSDSNTFIVDFKFDRKEFEPLVHYAKKWYLWYISNLFRRHSPQWDIEKDKLLVEYLKCETAQEWENLLAKWKKLGIADDKVQA